MTFDWLSSPFACLVCFLLPFASLLATALLPSVLPSHLCHLCHLCTLSLTNSDPCQRSTFLCLFLCRQPYDPSVPLLARILTIFFQCHSNLHWSACVVFPVGTVATFSKMMFSSATGSSLHDINVPRNLWFSRLSGIHFLTASIFNLFSNLFVSLVNVLRMSSNCSTSCALSLSEMLLISAAHADFLSDMFLSPPDRMPCFESLLSSCLLHYSQRFVCCRSVQYLVQQCLN